MICTLHGGPLDGKWLEHDQPPPELTLAMNPLEPLLVSVPVRDVFHREVDVTFRVGTGKDFPSVSHYRKSGPTKKGRVMMYWWEARP